MAKDFRDPSVGGGDLQPTRVGASVDLYRPGKGPGLDDALRKLGETLDPFGTGPLGQFYKNQREAALQAVDREFRRDAAVTEADVISRNPQLRGATDLVTRHLDALRGARGAIKARDFADLEIARRGLQGRPPEEVSAALDEIQAKALEVGGYDTDGEGAFLEHFSKYRRGLEDGALDAHIKAINEQHIADAGTTARHVIQSRASKQDWASFDDEFSEYVENEIALGMTREQAIAGWAAAMEEAVNLDPDVGGEGYRKMLEAESFDVDEAGNLIRRKVVTDPALRAAIAGKATAVDAAGHRASEDSWKLLKRNLEIESKTFDAAIAAEVRKGTPPEQIVDKFRKEIGKLHPMNQGVATDHLKKFVGVRDTFAAMPRSEFVAARNAALLGAYTYSDLAANGDEMSDQQFKSLSAAIDYHEKGAGVEQTRTFSHYMGLFKGLEEHAIPFVGGIENDVRNKLIIDLQSEFRLDLIEAVGRDPSLLQDEGRLEQVAKTFYDSVYNEIEARTPRTVQVQGPVSPNQAELATEFKSARQAIQEGISKYRGEAAQEVIKSGEIERVDPHGESIWYVDPEYMMDVFGDVESEFDFGAAAVQKPQAP